MEKKMFSNLFNTQENEFYMRPIPDQEYYGRYSMETDKRNSLMKWDDEIKNTVFNMRREMEKCCVPKTHHEEVQCMPIHCNTASVCNWIYMWEELIESQQNIHNLKKFIENHRTVVNMDRRRKENMYFACW
ncbi:hypothetical protein JTB14_027915 [Gonioctena quinquepunctata]|nr:hypothetical protein JTB14_027915 [Gonioctena quinquepunctata]